MKSHKYWSIGALITMLGTFYTGYKGSKEGHKYFAASSLLHIAKLNGRICGAKRSHSVFEQPNCYQSSLCNLILIMIVAISGMVNTSF